VSETVFGPYRPSRVVGDLVFISGQVGVNPSDKSAARDVASQTKQVMENMKRVLSAEGLTLAEVVKTTIFLKNMADFTAFNKIYGSYFAAPYPARSCVEVAGLPRVAGDTELLVEIEAIAERSQS